MVGGMGDNAVDLEGMMDGNILPIGNPLISGDDRLSQLSGIADEPQATTPLYKRVKDAVLSRIEQYKTNLGYGKNAGEVDKSRRQFVVDGLEKGLMATGVVGALYGILRARDVGADGNPSVIDMYNWNAVCTRKEHYKEKIPSSTKRSYGLEKDEFIKIYNSNKELRDIFNQIGLKDVLDQLTSRRDDSIASIRITNTSIDVGIETTNPDYSNMIVKGVARYFVSASIDESTSKRLIPYFK